MQINQSPAHKANIGYNGFDMSMHNQFSSTTGELLPVYYDLLYPGDKVTIKSTMRSRTMELSSYSFAKINEHLDWFFVPIDQLFSAFGSWYFGINDVNSSWFGDGSTSNVPESLPYFNNTALTAILTTYGQNDTLKTMFGYFGQERLCEMFNIPWRNIEAEENSSIGVSFLIPAAYQKIYADYYRLTDREYKDVYSYQVDRYVSQPALSIVDAARFFKLRYRPRRKDFFTNIFVSPLGTANDPSYLNTADMADTFNQWLVDGLVFYPASPDGSNGAGGVGDNPSYVQPQISGLGTGAAYVPVTQLKKYLNPTAIRTSFAVQKLLEVTRRARKTYDAQTLAHFGVGSPKHSDTEVWFLGSNESEITIGDVIATSTGSAGEETSVLGQVGGKGYGYSESRPITFENGNKMGILMCIYSADVEQFYNAKNIFDKLHTYMDRSSFYYPEYDNLGMQPLFAYQSNYDAGADNAYQYSIVGWQYRWSESKQKVNLIHGSLSDSLSSWTVASSTPGYLHNIADFYVSPFALNEIMLQPYVPTISIPSSGVGTFDSDPLIHDIYFDVKKASKMNVYSLETL